MGGVINTIGDALGGVGDLIGQGLNGSVREPDLGSLTMPESTLPTTRMRGCSSSRCGCYWRSWVRCIQYA